MYCNILSLVALMAITFVLMLSSWNLSAFGQSSNGGGGALEQALEKSSNSPVKKKKIKKENQMPPGLGGSMPNPAQQMGGMSGGTSNSPQKLGSMNGQKGDPMQGMGKMMNMMGKSMEDSTTSSPEEGLPGFPGNSHLYHVGGQDFFLNLQERLILSKDQIGQLSKIKNQFTELKTKSDDTINQAEENLWYLTSSDRPDNAAIESKIGEIEKLKGEERIEFIRSVGKATQILNEAQRRSAVRSSKYNTQPSSNQEPGNMPKDSSLPDNGKGMKEMPGDM